MTEYLDVGQYQYIKTKDMLTNSIFEYYEVPYYDQKGKYQIKRLYNSRDAELFALRASRRGGVS